MDALQTKTVVMDDDDDEACLFDLIGDPQALNYFLHGGGSKSNSEDLSNIGYSAANSNSIFANTSSSDPKSSIKGIGGQLGEGSNDGLQLPSTLQFLDDELESSPLPDLGEDQPFDILQKSLQEANITEQTLAEEAYLDANISSNQHPFSQTSVTQSPFSFGQAQKKGINLASSVASSKSQDSLRQPQSTNLLGQDTKIIQQPIGTVLPHPEKIAGSSLAQTNVQVDGHIVGQKRPAAKQLTKGAFILQQLQKDQAQAVAPDKSQFRSLRDAVQRLLSYHVCQGSLPTEEDLRKVDNEFESAATQLLKRTQSMLNKYRCLLLEDAMRITPSAEMVMIDRMFNQEERQSLSRDKRLAIVDPDGFLADFCCSSTQFDKGADETQLHESDHQTSKSSTSPNQTVNAQMRDKSSTAESLMCNKLHVVPNNIA
ncbi:GLTSCR1-like [Crotalus adamanteus]|uniref:GLTSCR1-like n=1 Tax=Crotalus adamanteus TaxID=8729 RepID=A0AAW1CDA9_CROAD